MKIKSLIFNSFLAFSIILGTFLFNSCSKEENTIQNGKENKIELPYRKTINLIDQHGNTLNFDLFSDDQTMLDSYSESNFTFTGMTEKDFIKHDEITLYDNNKGRDEEEYIDDNQTPITVVQKNMIVSLKTGFIGYCLEENWDSPEGLEDKAFEWHWENASQYDKAQVRNNRCCWAIYASWYWGNTATTCYNEIVVNHKIKGGGLSLYYGKKGSNWIRLKIQKIKP